MRKDKRKSIISVVVFIIFFFVISVGYILLIKPKTDYKIDKDSIRFVGDSKSVTIKSMLSVSNKFGKSIEDDNGGAFGYLVFDVTNDSNHSQKYQVYITKTDDAVKELNSGYVLFYLTDNNNQPYKGYTNNKLPSYDSLDGVIDKPGSYILYSDVLNANESAHFILRVWLAESYIVSDLEKTFSFTIDARAI